MKKVTIIREKSSVLVLFLLFFQFGCNQTAQEKPGATEISAPSHTEKIARGKYLVTFGSCNECHTPKIMTPQGPIDDTTKPLSGHPSGSPIPPFDKNVLRPGPWILFAADLTAAIGPFGITFGANLTPDSTTGIGAWTEDVFIQTLRTGKHLGQAGGRKILPPMPWNFVNKATDEDLKSIFAYLQALPPIQNKVPAPITPEDAAKLK